MAHVRKPHRKTLMPGNMENRLKASQRRREIRERIPNPYEIDGIGLVDHSLPNQYHSRRYASINNEHEAEIMNANPLTYRL